MADEEEEEEGRRVLRWTTATTTTNKREEEEEETTTSTSTTRFRGTFRVNPHDPSEAYVSVAFLPMDVKFRLGGRRRANDEGKANEKGITRRRMMASVFSPVDQDEVEFTLDSPIEWLREELREKSKTEANRRRGHAGKGRGHGVSSSSTSTSFPGGDETILQMMAECSVKDVRFGDRIKRAKRFEEAYGNDVSGNLEEVQKAYEEACRFFSRNSSGSTTSTTNNNTKDGVAEIELLRPLGTVVKVIEPSPRRKRLVGYIVEKKDNAGVTNTKKKNFQCLGEGFLEDWHWEWS